MTLTYFYYFNLSRTYIATTFIIPSIYICIFSMFFNIHARKLILFFFFFFFFYNIVLVLPYIDLNPLWVYM